LIINECIVIANIGRNRYKEFIRILKKILSFRYTRIFPPPPKMMMEIIISACPERTCPESHRGNRRVFPEGLVPSTELVYPEFIEGSRCRGSVGLGVFFLVFPHKNDSMLKTKY